MRKALFLFMVFGLVGLMCGCELGTTALSESDISHDYNEEVYLQKSTSLNLQTSSQP